MLCNATCERTFQGRYGRLEEAERVVRVGGPAPLPRRKALVLAESKSLHGARDKDGALWPLRRHFGDTGLVVLRHFGDTGLVVLCARALVVVGRLACA